MLSGDIWPESPLLNHICKVRWPQQGHGCRIMSSMFLFFILFWVWVTDHRRNCLHFSMNMVRISLVHRRVTLFRTPSQLFVWLLTFNVSSQRRSLNRNMPTSCPVAGIVFSVARIDHRSHRGSNLLPSNIMASALTTIHSLLHNWNNIFGLVMGLFFNMFIRNNC